MPRARDQAVIDAFAAVLRYARSQKGFTQEELAFAADVDRTFIGLLETSKRQPTISVIFALARALDMTPDLLVKRTRAAVEA